MTPPLARLVESHVLSDSYTARLYDRACSQLRFVVDPTLVARASALEELGGVRIFSSDDRREDVGRRVPPPTCPLTKGTLGRWTMAQVRSERPSLLGAERTYVGNWAILVRRPGQTGPKYVTVCGFYEGGARKGFGSGSRRKHERLVKHVHLCTYARNRRADYAYLFTGTFVAGASGTKGFDVLVNARSGTWALAKHVLTLGGVEYDDGGLDAAATAFAAPRVALRCAAACGLLRRGAKK